MRTIINQNALLRKFLSPPSADELAQRELDDAKRHLLETQRQRDYYSKMCDFYTARIAATTRQLRRPADEPQGETLPERTG